MARGTFANVRLRNALVAGVEGGYTRYLPDGTQLVVIAGKEYGSGIVARLGAKGPMLLGIRAVIAESFERIHRSNLIGMGILPLEFAPGDDRTSLGIEGDELFTIAGLPERIPRNRDGEASDERRRDGVRSGRADRHARRSGILPVFAIA